MARLPAPSSTGLARAVLNSTIVAVATIIGSVAALLSRLFDGSGETVLRFARVWSRAIARLTGLRVEVESRVPLDLGRSYVFMANHLSTVDIWALYIALPIPPRMLAKKQLAAIPLLGWAMWAGRFIFIDRGNAAAARRSIDRAKERIRGGESVLIFPEGTRSRDGQMLPFKKGGFHLAIDAGAPIVPVSIEGSREAMPAGTLLVRGGRVKIKIGVPIETAGLSEEDREQLLDRVRAEIVALLSRSP
jgi:1-acyl-sn-glycerol-3-phosphate acyltransferase